MGWCGWVMLICNAVVPQIFWFKAARRSAWTLFTVCVLVNVGMWFERFVIIAIGLHRDFLPSSWGSYYPSYVEVLTLDRQLRPVPDPVPPLLPLAADGGDGRGEGRVGTRTRRGGEGERGRGGDTDTGNCRMQCTAFRTARQDGTEAVPQASHPPSPRLPISLSRASWPNTTARGACWRRPTACARRAASAGTASAPSRSTGSIGRWASGRPSCRGWCSLAGSVGGTGRPGHAMVLQRAAGGGRQARRAGRQSPDRQRQALLEPAGQYPHRFRAFRAVCCADGVPRAVGAGAAAAAALPGLRQPAVPPGRPTTASSW